MPIYIIAPIVLVILLFLAIILALRKRGKYEPPERRAGRLGEERATHIIEKYLYEDDRLFTNVQIEYDGRSAELDNIIVNKYGVFIIEVKTYRGCLVGKADDYEWQKHRMTPAGNIYTKSVKNPLRQVKRQIYLLAKYLDYYGVDVWVSGYAFLVNGNSPVEDEHMISLPEDIGKIIHTPGRRLNTPKQINDICKLIA